MTTHAERDLLLIPVSALVRSPLNVRKTTPTEGIEELAAMIAAQGLLQNLTVVPGKTTRKGSTYEVVAGGRRLAALQRLVKQRTLKGAHEVPCLVVTSEEAIEISTAENSGRVAMHPADQFEAFRGMVEAGRSIEDVAARFGLQPVTVQRRLKLANLAPRFLALYREGAVALDELMALALVEDHPRQEAAWDSLQDWQRHASALRRVLMDEKVLHTEPQARFVGVKAYEKAGGKVERDLFAEDGACYFADPALLGQLAGAKLEKAAQKIRAEGWAWVKVRESLDYADLAVFKRVRSSMREATPEEQTQIDALEQEVQMLEVELESDVDADREKAIYARQRDIDNALEQLDTAREETDPAQQVKAGVLVSITYDGKLRIERGLLKPADAKQLQRDAAPGTASESVDSVSSGHSEALNRRLTAHRTRALQVEVARRPDVALVATVHALACDTFYSHPWGATVNVRGSNNDLSAHAPDIEHSAAEQAMRAECERWTSQLPKDVDALFGWLQTQAQEVLLGLLAYCTATTINGVRFQGGGCEADTLAVAVELDMHRWWKPTAEAYFQAMSKARIFDCIAELTGAPVDAVTLGKMKKAALADHAAKLAEDDGWQWLPAPMRSNAA